MTSTGLFLAAFCGAQKNKQIHWNVVRNHCLSIFENASFHVFYDLGAGNRALDLYKFRVISMVSGLRSGRTHRPVSQPMGTSQVGVSRPRACHGPVHRLAIEDLEPRPTLNFTKFLSSVRVVFRTTMWRDVSMQCRGTAIPKGSRSPTTVISAAPVRSNSASNAVNIVNL